jgi:hypothetical protein
MKEYFDQKYPLSKANRYVYSIVPRNTLIEYKLRNSIYPEGMICFIYSGGNQKWQNISQIFDFIEQNDKDNYFYIFLSHQKDFFESIIGDRFSAIKDRFFVTSVLPEKLPEYYSQAHYGFLLRDDHILNKVSMPTKMVEYLYYGITPIVKLKEIGDFVDYEYVDISVPNIEFYPHKSGKNIQIIKNIIELNNNNIFDRIFH